MSDPLQDAIDWAKGMANELDQPFDLNPMDSPIFRGVVTPTASGPTGTPAAAPLNPITTTAGSLVLWGGLAALIYAFMSKRRK